MLQIGRRALGLAVTLLLLAALVAGHAMAEHAAGDKAVADGCDGRSDVLGVSRVVEVDTHGGAAFGFQYHKAPDYLQDGEVVLTFDDGPSRSHTRAVLDALDAHCTKATFFMVGRMAVADPEMVREVARHGHTIGTHTWSHRNLRTLLPARAKAEIEMSVSAVSRILGTPVAPFFRFPYLSDPRPMIEYLKERDIGIFSIDVDSIDYRTRSGTEIQRRVLSLLAKQRKGILLFHDIQTSTARGIRGLLDQLKARGFKVVHLIPKAAATTVADFDAAAEQELARKAAAAAGKPLANRSIVWATGDEEERPAVRRKRHRPSAAASKGRRSDDNSWHLRN